jgi:hypothetical protein
MEISLEQAFQNIKLAVESFKGSLQEHMALQESLKKLQEKLFEAKQGEEK